MDLQPTLIYYWTPTGVLPLLNGPTPGMYTEPISTDGADQLGIFVVASPTPGGVAANIFLRVAWAGLIEDGLSPAVFVEECVEVPGASVNGAQRYSLTVKEYGPIAIGPSARATIWLPTAAHFFKVGCYADVTPSAGSLVTAYVEMGKTGSPFSQAR